MLPDHFAAGVDFGHPDATVVDKSNGVHIKFPNGWVVSVQWGPGTYSTNHDHHSLGRFDFPPSGLEALTAEVAAWKRDGGMIRWPDGDTVQGWQSWQEVQAVLELAARDALDGSEVSAARGSERDPERDGAGRRRPFPVVSPLTTRAATHAEKFYAALVECATLAGADISGGVPGWPPVDEWAVSEVRQLREDYDAALDEIGLTRGALDEGRADLTRQVNFDNQARRATMPTDKSALGPGPQNQPVCQNCKGAGMVKLTPIPYDPRQSDRCSACGGSGKGKP